MKVLFFDTETDGLIKTQLLRKEKWPRIIEIYAALYDGPDMIDEYDQLINPGRNLPKEITKITGLKDDDLADKKSFAFYHQRIKVLFEKADRIVAHNLSFDKMMIDCDTARSNLEPVVWPNDMFCTVEQTEHLYGRRLKLTDLHQHYFGEPLADAHRAKNDVQGMIKCYFKLMEE